MAVTANDIGLRALLYAGRPPPGAEGSVPRSLHAFLHSTLVLPAEQRLRSRDVARSRFVLEFCK